MRVRALLAVTLLAAVAAGGCGNDEFDAAVGRYCNYGAASRAQYDGCMDHVTYDDVLRAYKRDSEAGAYAVECDGTSGAYTGAASRPDCELRFDD